MEFADEERESLRFSFQHAAERLLDLLADDERWDPMIPLARKAAQQNPYHEAFQDHLLTALLALGHKQEVLSAYARYEKLMTQELDLLPSEDLKRLAEKAAQL